MSNLSTSPETTGRLGSIKIRTLSFKTPRKLYALHRFLFRLTNGRWNDTVHSVLKVVNGRYPEIEPKTSQFKYNPVAVAKVVETLDRDGFCILEQKLSDDTVERLLSFSQKTPVKCVLPGDYGQAGSQFANEDILIADAKNRSARCLHDTADILKNSEVQSLALDPLLLNIAQDYLDVKPLLSSVVMWWSLPVEDKEKFAGAAAQEYHFDMDRLKFFNFFIYLTDVDTNNGPHCYVRGSHKKLPPQFRRRGRFSDKDVKAHYGHDVLELTGKKGTIMAVDTRGLHKGKVLTEGSRLIMQIGFADSLFGEYYPRVAFQNLSEERQKFASDHFESYFNFL